MVPLHIHNLSPFYCLGKLFSEVLIAASGYMRPTAMLGDVPEDVRHPQWTDDLACSGADLTLAS